MNSLTEILAVLDDAVVLSDGADYSLQSRDIYRVKSDGYLASTPTYRFVDMEDGDGA